jgi:hypothetical protein
MNTTVSNDDEFLKTAISLCEKIDCYADILNLDPLKVLAFKSNKMLLDFAYNNREHFNNFKKSAMNNGIVNLKIIFSELVEQCKGSANYTNQIGQELGIISTDIEEDAEALVTGLNDNRGK